MYFLSLGLKVTGIDASDTAIHKLTSITQGSNNAKFLCGDFVTDTEIYGTQYDYIYSRFTLHAINTHQEYELLINAKRSLKPDGKIFIEAWTIHDDLYGKGQQITENTFIHKILFC